MPSFIYNCLRALFFMTPKEKAKELVDKFKEVNVQYVLNGMANTADVLDEAKECASIAINEILIAVKFTNDSKYYVNQSEYLQQVKEEIKNYKTLKQ